MMRNEFLSSLFIVVLAAVAIWAGYKADAAEAKVRDLSQQIVEWQKASVPAINTRKWFILGSSLESIEDIKPEHLKYALDRCYTTSSGDRLSDC